MTGFKLFETMEGYHYFPNDERGTKRYMKFECSWGPENIKHFLIPQPDRFLIAPLRGNVTIDGLCRKAPMEGMVELDYFGRGTITYEFTFKVKDRWCVYKGEKVNIKPWNLLTSHTTCFGTVHGFDGELISTSVTFFKLKTALDFVKSFKLTWR
jgi:hypothetical protein